ncbi:amidase [Candidatus Bathyarchaeota archaeon]|nr:amidase [Candidatus Bathyarchaeota archaeon]
MVRTGEASPVELTEFFLDRLEKLGSKYNAVVTVTRERALESAAKAEKEIENGLYKGFLHGIPFGVKDLLATSGGIPTTWGAAPLKNQVFDYDATVIKKLEEAGAILCAKLAMIELAGGMGYRQPNASFTGPCRNPWNVETWSGGSSSGSGAAVAAGLVPFALGSETWGSILSPANNCGVAGLRPTYGLVSRFGAMPLSWTLDKIGPLCLTADDCGIILEHIAGPDPADPSTSRSFKYEAPNFEREFKLAFFKGVLEGVEEDVSKNFHKALEDLEEVATIEEVEPPEMPYEAIARTIINVESASAFEEFIDSGKASELTAPEDRYPYARMAIPATEYLRALRLRGIACKAVGRLIAPYDAVVAPTSRRAATPIDTEFRSLSPSARDIMGAVGNLAGLPAISIPNGFTRRGLPTGMQFMGSPFSENSIIAVAKVYQSLTDWHERHPQVS